MKRLLAIILFSVCAFAQSELTFEVADVKISAPGERQNVDFLPGGKLVVQYLTMKEMIAAAWDLRGDYVTGSQPWLNSEHYDIVAKAAHTSSEKDLKQMLKNLLIERFKLEVHIEKKEMPVFLMVVGKKGSKLKESPAGENPQPDCKLTRPNERKDGLILRTLACKKMPMDAFAELIQGYAGGYIDRPVVNLTELKGLYDFTLEWAPVRGGRGPNAPPTDGAPPELDGPTVFAALETQLGLHLDQKKHLMDTIVVDKVERVPSDN